MRASWHSVKGGCHEAASCDILRYSWASQEVTPSRKKWPSGATGSTQPLSLRQPSHRLRVFQVQGPWEPLARGGGQAALA